MHYHFQILQRALPCPEQYSKMIGQLVVRNERDSAVSFGCMLYIATVLSMCQMSDLQAERERDGVERGEEEEGCPAVHRHSGGIDGVSGQSSHQHEHTLDPRDPAEEGAWKHGRRKHLKRQVEEVVPNRFHHSEVRHIMVACSEATAARDRGNYFKKNRQIFFFLKEFRLFLIKLQSLNCTFTDHTLKDIPYLILTDANLSMIFNLLKPPVCVS